MATSAVPVSPQSYKPTSPVPTSPQGYTDGFGRHVDENDVEKWFTYGVKATGQEATPSICSKRATLYILAISIFLVVLGVVIIVPVAIGTSQKG